MKPAIGRLHHAAHVAGARAVDEALMLERLERPLPANWQEQRPAFRCAG
jgi:hypothetical protein